MVDSKNIKALLTEFIGSFLIVFVTCWSFTALQLDQIGYLALGIANALIVASCAWAGYTNSGAHFNPVITILRLSMGNMNPSKAVFYIIAQLLGSFFAALLVILLIPYDFQQDLETFIGFPKISIIVSDFQAFLMEFIFSMLYVFVYFATIVDKRAPTSVFGFALGAVILLGSISIGAYTNACINPIRIFGPHLLIGRVNNTVIYWLANLTGGIFAGFYYTFFFLRNKEFGNEEEDDDRKNNMMNAENFHEAMNLKY